MRCIVFGSVYVDWVSAFSVTTTHSFYIVDAVVVGTIVELEAQNACCSAR